MQIRRFFCPALDETSTVISLPETEATHALRVLRLRAGDSMMLMNGQGLTADAILSPESTNKKAICEIQKIQKSPEQAVRLHLFIAPPHTKVFDQILRAAVEFGIFRIVPVITQFSTAKPEGKPDAWNNALIAAMKQAINPWLPEVATPLRFEDALKCSPRKGWFGATPHHGLESAPTPQNSSQDIAVWVGPEGGFCEQEEIELRQAGLTPVSVGNYVLRVENAVPALITVALLSHNKSF